MKFSVVGYYLYGAPANGNTLQGQLFLRPLRDAVAALHGFQFGNIAEENLSRSSDEVQLTLDKGGRGEVSAASQWQEAHSPLQVILQASLLESGGRPVTRRVEQAIWPADTLPGIRPQFAAKAVYDYRTDTTVNQPIVDEDSNAAFDIVYANAQGEKKRCLVYRCGSSASVATITGTGRKAKAGSRSLIKRSGGGRADAGSERG